MKYYTRRWVKHEDLNPANRLFGGKAMAWIDEEAAIFASCQMSTDSIVTKFISEIDFVNSAELGDIVEFGFKVIDAGNTSLTVAGELRNKKTHKVIVQVEKMVFVALNHDGIPVSYQKNHGADLIEDKIA